MTYIMNLDWNITWVTLKNLDTHFGGLATVNRIQEGRPLNDVELASFEKEIVLDEPPAEGSQDFLRGSDCSAMIVSDRVRFAIQELEPDVHQFIGLNLNYGKGMKKYKKIFGGVNYFILNVCQRFNAVCLEKSSGIKMEFKKSEQILHEFTLEVTNYDLDRQEDNLKIYIDSEVFKGKHLWGGCMIR